MDIKKFLKDNKGCPLTVPAIKQLLVKFIELLSEKGELTKEEAAWVSQMKELISVDDDNAVLMQNVHIENTCYIESYLKLFSISSIQNEDEDSFFPSLTDQAGKCVVVNDDETGFEYVNKPTLLETDYDFESLPQSLLEQVKIGDIIYSTDVQETAQVDDADENYVFIKRYNNDKVYIYVYTKESNVWSCEVTETPIGGTKLYRHHLSFDNDTYAFDIISWSSTPITSSFNAEVGVSCLSISLEQITIKWSFLPYYVDYDEDTTSLFVYEDGNSSSINIQVSSVTDTVTPL